MTPRTLRRICTAVWGRGWAFELALAIGRHPQTVARWRAGLSRMSNEDHYRVLQACLIHSRERYRITRQMIAGLHAPAHGLDKAAETMREELEIVRQMVAGVKHPKEG